ncbi:MAG TPA: hypothetical protein VHJ77_19780 [Vicinamibacterales bacterium]|jgi:pectate lyase|nr:hypothetical protein [Vicinamibacterales bacterium]
MRVPAVIVTTAMMAAGVWGTTAAAHNKRDVGRDVLAANDGWASLGTGTTGGSAAADEQVYTVRTRAELIAALNNGVSSPTSPSSPSNEPKIIYVDGTIDFNVDDDNQPLTCEDYYRNGFTIEAFLEQFDPEGPWGRVPPSGPLEDARIASRNAQQDRVRIRPGSNTTIVGLGKDATLRGIWLDIRGTANVAGSRTNIIVRNLTFEDTYDCFPQWSPTDGTLGSWNALYDSVSLRDSDHVWVDHKRFRDRRTADATLPIYFGVLFQVHDGLLDITNASDLVTVSWNRFVNHDKLMLIGSSDSATADRNKLRVTLHHNLFSNIGQRSPRVRFGQVHIYNNLYRIRNEEHYQYSWGVGIESQAYAENNFFRTDEAVTPDRFITRLNGTAIFETGTLVNGESHRHLVDVVDAYNAVNDPDLLDTVSWAPTLFLEVDPTKNVPKIVRKGAGPF